MFSRKENIKKIIIAVSIVIIYILLAIFIRPVFYLNDDITIRSIISGSYSGVPDGHAVYMSYPLSGFLALLYRIVPVIPWFDIFISGILLSCIILIVTSYKEFSVWWVIVSFLFCAAVFAEALFYVHYSIVAVTVAGSAIALWTLRENKTSSLVLMILAAMIRRQFFLLSLPFLAVAVLYDILYRKETDDGKKLIRNSLIAVAAIIAGVLAIAGINSIMYSSDSWKEYRKYNDERTRLYDYTGFPSMGEDSPAIQALDIPDNEKKLLLSYNTMLSEADANLLSDIADSMPNEKPAPREAVKEYLNHIKYDRNPLRMLLLFLYPASIAAFIVKRKWIGLGHIICLFCGRSLIWVYLIMQGRFPERINFSLLILEIMVLIGWILRLFMQRKKDKPGYNPVWTLLIISGVCFVALSINFAKDRIADQHLNQKSWDVLKDYFAEHEENEYLLDVYSHVAYAERLYEKGPENAMLLGGWMTNTPLSRHKLSESEKLFFVVDSDREISWMEDAFSSGFGKCELTEDDEIILPSGKEYKIYQITKTE